MSAWLRASVGHDSPGEVDRVTLLHMPAEMGTDRLHRQSPGQAQSAASQPGQLSTHCRVFIFITNREGV